MRTRIPCAILVSPLPQHRVRRPQRRVRKDKQHLVRKDNKGGIRVTETGATLVRNSDSREARQLQRSERELIEQIESTLELLQGKWKVYLVFLMARGVHRHCRLLECLPGASKKMMTDTLRTLERDGLVARRIFAEVPLRVEYSLTPLGWTITDPLMALAEWQEAHGDEAREARLRHRFDGVDVAEQRAAERLAAAREAARRRPTAAVAR
jgi:DNA-binding HxlR family transcriptional regulator